MIGGRPQQECHASRIFEGVGNDLNGVIQTQVGIYILKLGVIKSITARMLDRATDTVRVIQTLQRCLTPRAGLSKVDRMIWIALDLEGAALHRADDQSAAGRTFAAGGGVISAQ